MRQPTSTSIFTPAPASAAAAVVRPAAPPVYPLNFPACGASLLLTLLHFVFAVFSVAFRRDTAAPVIAPEAPFAPGTVPDLPALQAFKITLFDAMDAFDSSIPSVQATASLGIIASTCPACAARLATLQSPSPSQSHSSSIQVRRPGEPSRPQSAIRNTSVFCLLTPASSLPHCFRPPPPT